MDEAVTPKQPDPTRWWTLAVVCAAIFMLLIDITIVNVALPDIQKAFNSSFSNLQWVIDAYALTLASFVLNAGSLADRYGRRLLFLIGVGIFTLASALCGAAVSDFMLIAMRALQGVGAAIMFAVSLALLANSFHGRERGTAFGIWGAVTGAAVAIGPLAGGALTSWISWHWIFYINVPIGLLTLVVGAWKVRESRDPGANKTDWIGVVTLSAALFCLIFALLRGNNWGWTAAKTLGLLNAGGTLTVAYLLNEALSPNRSLPLGWFRIPAFTGTQLAAFGISASIFSMFLYLTLYLQNVLGFSAIDAGLRFLPTTLLAFFVAPIAGRLSARVRPQLLISFGLALIAESLLLMYGLGADSEWTALLPGFILAGIGIGMVNPPLASTAISVVPAAESGTASGVNNTFRQVGIASGIAVLGAIFQHRVGDELRGSLGSLPIPKGALDGLTVAVSSGRVHEAAQAAPVAVRALVETSSKEAFIVAINQLFLVGAAIAGVAAVLAFVLLRKQPATGQARGAAEG